MPFDPFEYVRGLKLASLRVHAPTSVIFICGGTTDDTQDLPISLRDGFLRQIRNNHLLDYTIVIAEVAEPLLPSSGYKDLFQFENDIAGAVSLIFLFSESPGSLAELGAFSALNKVAPKLLAVIDDYYYHEESFVKNGPIQYLENEHGDEWVFLLERDVIGMGEKGEPQNVNYDHLCDILVPVIADRVKGNPESEKFDSDTPGHLVLLITGFIQDYGALKLNEIKEFLEIVKLNYRDIRIRNFLYCAELMGWVKKRKTGNHTFYIAQNAKKSISFKFKPEVKQKDKLRWRSDIRAYWKEHDRPRFNAIIEAAGVDGDGND